MIYYSFRQNSSIFSNLVIRTSTDPIVLAATVRRESRSGAEDGDNSKCHEAGDHEVDK